jgi:hypothetical protein
VVTPDDANPAGIADAPLGDIRRTAAVVSAAAWTMSEQPAPLSATIGAYSAVRLDANAASVTSM